MEDRIAKLERRCRRQNATIGAMLLGCSLLVLTGADDKNQPTELRASKITIVDPEGVPRIILGADEVRGTITMASTKGDPIFEINCSDTNFEEALYDSKKELRFTNSMTGATNTTAMRFYDSKGKPRYTLESGLNDNFQLHLLSPKGHLIQDLFQ